MDAGTVGTRMLEFYRAVGSQHPHEGMTAEQAGEHFLEQKGQDSTTGSHYMHGILEQTGLGEQKMQENARKDAEELNAVYGKYGEKPVATPKLNNLHGYESFQRSVSPDPSHQLITPRQMAVGKASAGWLTA